MHALPVTVKMPDSTTMYNLLKEIYFLLDDGDRQLLSQFELTIPRFYMLVHLRQSPGLAPNQLSERMLCDKSNIARLVKGMETDKLLYRQPHETDGRSYRLYLTKRGRELCEKALSAHTQYNAKRFCQNELDNKRVWQSLNQLKEKLKSDLLP